MFTCRDGKAGVFSSQATKMLYSPRSAANIYHLLTESEVITGKSQTEALMYGPSDREVDTSRPRSEISL